MDEVVNRLGEAIQGGIGHAQDLGGDGRVKGDDVGDGAHGTVGRFNGGAHLVQGLGQCGERGEAADKAGDAR